MREDPARALDRLKGELRYAPLAGFVLALLPTFWVGLPWYAAIGLSIVLGFAFCGLVAFLMALD